MIENRAPGGARRRRWSARPRGARAASRGTLPGRSPPAVRPRALPCGLPRRPPRLPPRCPPRTPPPSRAHVPRVLAVARWPGGAVVPACCPRAPPRAGTGLGGSSGARQPPVNGPCVALQGVRGVGRPSRSPGPAAGAGGRPGSAASDGAAPVPPPTGAPAAGPRLRAGTVVAGGPPHRGASPPVRPRHPPTARRSRNSQWTPPSGPPAPHPHPRAAPAAPCSRGTRGPAGRQDERRLRAAESGPPPRRCRREESGCVWSRARAAEGGDAERHRPDTTRGPDLPARAS